MESLPARPANGIVDRAIRRTGRRPEPRVKMMLIGVDSYSYHRCFGDLRPSEVPRAGPRWPLSPVPVLAHTAELGVECVFLETCFLPAPGDLDPAELKGKVEPGPISLGPPMAPRPRARSRRRPQLGRRRRPLSLGRARRLARAPGDADHGGQPGEPSGRAGRSAPASTCSRAAPGCVTEWRARAFV